MTAQIRALLLDPVHRQLRLRGAFLLFAIIVIGGSIPGARAEMGQVASGYVLHSTAYAVIAFLLVTGMQGLLGGRAVRAVLTVAAMGAVDEFVQSFFPYRHADVRDWMVDVTAALVASLLLYLLLPKRKH
ncbi:VanZ family protein [Massilia arenosa]|uniref:VanZ family protein n=1 Tax=Zemynaea arenosa TaxID=2561931 RepID=A0A4Y9S657_9BURK|nr:VanZ family protein [Massilia arenosa]TFW16975.1 VanZ family protein [Massilia arenosa]